MLVVAVGSASEGLEGSEGSRVCAPGGLARGEAWGCEREWYGGLVSGHVLKWMNALEDVYYTWDDGACIRQLVSNPASLVGTLPQSPCFAAAAAAAPAGPLLLLAAAPASSCVRCVRPHVADGCAGTTAGEGGRSSSAGVGAGQGCAASGLGALQCRARDQQRGADRPA